MAKKRDLISRQAVERITWEEPSYFDPLNVLTEVREKVRALPPIENKGEWIDYTWYDKDLQSTRWGIKCNKCNKEYPHFANLSRDFHFCPNCGADMRGEE